MSYIELYKGNSKTITCDVSGLTDLSGYTGTLTVKKGPDETIIIEKLGSIDSSLQLRFDIGYTDSSVEPYSYIYDITIDNSTNRYTLIQDNFIVLDSVRY